MTMTSDPLRPNRSPVVPGLPINLQFSSPASSCGSTPFSKIKCMMLVLPCANGLPITGSGYCAGCHEKLDPLGFAAGEFRSGRSLAILTIMAVALIRAEYISRTHDFSNVVEFKDAS